MYKKNCLKIVYRLTSSKSKLLAASKLGKTVFYVPKDNAAEATDLEIRDIDVRPIENMSTVLRDLWDI